MTPFTIRFIRLLLGFLIWTPSLATADPQEDWRDKWMLEMDSMGTRSIQEQLERLAIAVRARSIKSGQHPTANQLAVGTRAAAMLVAIPGYADYYGNKIRTIMDDEVAKTGAGDSRQRIWTFETLEQLPSPETVKVLGELLYDDRDPYQGIDHGDTGTPIPNFKRASMALTRLGIRKAPVTNTLPGRSGFEESEVHTWKLWYEQVRDGTRTFSFEGDEAIYSLSGRVSVERDGPVRSRPDRKPQTAGAEEASGEAAEISNRIPVIITTLLLVGIVIFTVRQMRCRVS